MTRESAKRIAIAAVLRMRPEMRPARIVDGMVYFDFAYEPFIPLVQADIPLLSSRDRRAEVRQVPERHFIHYVEGAKFACQLLGRDSGDVVPWNGKIATV